MRRRSASTSKPQPKQRSVELVVSSRTAEGLQCAQQGGVELARIFEHQEVTNTGENDRLNAMSLQGRDIGWTYIRMDCHERRGNLLQGRDEWWMPVQRVSNRTDRGVLRCARHVGRNAIDKRRVGVGRK